MGPKCGPRPMDVCTICGQNREASGASEGGGGPASVAVLDAGREGDRLAFCCLGPFDTGKGVSLSPIHIYLIVKKDAHSL